VQSTCLLLQSGTRECSLVRRNRLDDLANQWRPDILFNPAAPCSDHCKHFTVERAEPRLGLCYSLVAGSRRPDQHAALIPRLEIQTPSEPRSRQRDRRRGDIQQRRRYRRAMDAIHAVQAARQENDQVKAKSLKIWALRARSDGCRGQGVDGK